MRALDRTGVEQWCRAHGYALNERSLPALRDAAECETFSIPADAGQRVAMVRGHMATFREEMEICVWLDDWSVWPSGQWHHLFERFRASYGITDHLVSQPAHVLRGEEIEAAMSIAVYSALMLWDCYVLGASGSPFLFYSHDEYGKRRANQSVDPTPWSAPRSSASRSQD